MELCKESEESEMVVMRKTYLEEGSTLGSVTCLKWKRKKRKRKEKTMDSVDLAISISRRCPRATFFVTHFV
jgi:hypothetical protein